MVCYEARNFLPQKGQKSQQNHSPFPPSKIEKAKFPDLTERRKPSYIARGSGQRTGGFNEHYTNNGLVSGDFVWAVR